MMLLFSYINKRNNLRRSDLRILLFENLKVQARSIYRLGMQKGANFCTTLLLLYHTSDWLNQQNLPKLQVAVYLSLIDQLFSFQQNVSRV